MVKSLKTERLWFLRTNVIVLSCEQVLMEDLKRNHLSSCTPIFWKPLSALVRMEIVLQLGEFKGGELCCKGR